MDERGGGGFMEEAGEAGMDELGGGGHERSLEGEGRWPRKR